MKHFGIATLFFLVSAFVSAQMVTDGLIAYWPLEGDGKDSVGKLHADVKGEPKVVDGKLGKAFEFDGVDDYIQLPDMGHKAAVTVECWAKIDTIGWQGGYRGLVSHVEWRPGTVHFRMAFNKGVNAIKNDKPRKQTPDMPGLVVDRWYHCVYTSDMDTKIMVAYADGKSLGEAPLGGELNDLTNVRVGSEFGDRFFPGIIDEVKIYDRALAPEEIIQNMEARGTAVIGLGSNKAITWGSIKSR